MSEDWHAWQVLYEPIAQEVVKDWDDLTYSDLWVDPRVGLAFCREIARARG